MVDALKIAAKVALIVVVTGAILLLFANIQIPNVDFSVLTQGASTGVAVLFHWIPITTVLLPLGIGILSLELAITLFNFAMIAVRWIFKVNE